MANLSKARGVHLVGSMNLPDTHAVFSQIPKLLPHRLRRLPDGETGVRDYFILWQQSLFSSVPEILITNYPFNDPLDLAPPPSAEEHAAVMQKLRAQEPLETKYDSYALESYAVFAKMKEEGEIDRETRFQVSLPSVLNVLALIHPSYQEAVEPLYEAALLRSLQRIQARIPADELAIQFDASVEFALLEKVPQFQFYFTATIDNVAERLARLGRQVQSDVELGFHLCYGDIAHKHFVQPKDLSFVVEVANALMRKVERPIGWVHVPVPKDRTDAAYFEPLKKLKRPEGMELHLGLVHPGDLEGTKERMAAAREAWGGQFGVATECGMGRVPKEEFDGIMEILREVSAEVV